jgi:hypothetical protein
LLAVRFHPFITDHLASASDPWSEDADFPVADWQHAVANDETRLGYKDWCDHQRQMEEEDA